MKSLKDKEKDINTILGFKCFEKSDVKDAVLEFKERFYSRNKPDSLDSNKKIIDLFVEIFGDFEK